MADTRILLSVETDDFTVSLKGSPFHPSAPGVIYEEGDSCVSLHGNRAFTVTVEDAEPVEAAARSTGQFGTVIPVRPLFFEQSSVEIIIEPAPGKNVTFFHENQRLREAVSPVGRYGVLTGVLRFANDIGYSDLVINADGKPALTITIEVFPSKISYQEDYKAIVTDVTTEIYNLVFDFLRKTYDTFDINGEGNPSHVEFFAILRKLFKQLLQAADTVLVRPHHELTTLHPLLPGHKIRRTDNQTIKWLRAHPEQMIRKGSRVLAAKAPAVQKHVSFDTTENRLTKYMLERTVRRLEQFRTLYAGQRRDTDSVFLQELDSMTGELRRRLRTGILRDIPSEAGTAGLSLVFAMAPGYRELYRYYLMLRHGLSVTGTFFSLSVKDLAVLYEYWCFIKLNSLMRNRYRLLSQDIVRSSGAGLSVTLIKGKKSQVVYRNPATGEKITLAYNSSSGSATVAQKPDNVLTLEKHGSAGDYSFVFDAKYKIDPAVPGTAYARDYKTPGPKEEDINTMHRYRDAIVSGKDNLPPYRRDMFGAYVLFPYADAAAYRNHRFFRSIDEVNIGGLPFLPSETGMVTEMLDALIGDSAASAFERATLPRGIEARLKKTDWTRRNALVVAMGSKSEAALSESHRCLWVRRDQLKDEDFPVRTVAPYLPPNIFGTDAGVFRRGTVIRTSLVESDKVPPSLCNTGADPVEMFWQFEVREWKDLPSAILPRNDQVNRLFTTEFLLEHADGLPELRLQSEEEFRFYAELKRLSVDSVYEQKRNSRGFVTANGQTVSFEGEDIILRSGDLELDRVPVADFRRRPGSVFRKLHEKAEAVETRG